MKCLVCSSECIRSLYATKTQMSITSLSKMVNADTRVFLCEQCTHVQTEPLSDLVEYYDQNYNILMNSIDEDQLYVAKDGTREFRLHYQLKIFDCKISLSSGAKLLDYGCAKASTLRLIVENRNDIIPMCYDVSDSYIPFWSKFVDEEYHFAKKRLGNELTGKIDCITSFFSLEHAADPLEFVKDVARLLKDNGQFLCIVPNLFANWADFVVVDHINHFTKLSIINLFKQAGLYILEIDEAIYNGAYVVVAKKVISSCETDFSSASKESIISDITKVANYWIKFREKINVIQTDLKNKKFMVYGAGFYSAYITSLINDMPVCYIDQNPYLQGSDFFGAPVVSVDQVNSEIKDIVVGINPLNAGLIIERDVMQKLPHHNFIYLGTE